MRAADGVVLRGTLTIPEGFVDSAVVLLHGISVDRHEYLGFYDHLADILADTGVCSLRFDLRSHGESSFPQEEMTIAGLCLDAKAAIREIRNRYPDLSHLTILGTSFGAAPAAYAGYSEPRVTGVMLFAPVLDYTLTFLRPETDWARESFTREALDKVVDQGYLLLDGERRLGARLLTEMELLDPLAAVRNAPVQTIIIHGASDTMVPVTQSQRAVTGNSLVDVRIIPSMDHGYMDIDDPNGTSQQSLANRESIQNALVALATGAAVS